MTAVHVVVPDSIDDPAQPSGGNVYDRRICDGLAALGWSVHEHPVPGAWPRPDTAARHALSAELRRLADGALVLIDGLIASAATDLPAFAGRLRVVVLVHMPLGHDPLSPAPDGRAQECAVEEAALSAATAVIATSNWTKGWLAGQYALEPDRIRVVEPGTDAAEPAPGSHDGQRRGAGQLLCVAAITPAKGHDALIAALGQLADLPWTCVCVGAVDRDPQFVARLRRDAGESGIAGRIRFVGTRTGADLAAAYSAADLVVVSSLAETYGMVVTEALARGIPVIATAVGGVPDALGFGSDRIRPGILVPPGDPAALAAALRGWLSDADLRLRLRQAARQRRDTLQRWSATARRLSGILTDLSAAP